MGCFPIVKHSKFELLKKRTIRVSIKFACSRVLTSEKYKAFVMHPPSTLNQLNTQQLVKITKKFEKLVKEHSLKYISASTSQSNKNVQ